jgi:DNA-binding MarR family transcriptional regulator
MEKISEIGIWIAQIHQISDRLMEMKLKENQLEGFSAAQGRVLFILEQIPNEQLLKIPIQGLVKRLKLSSSTFTQLLDSLQDKGLIERIHSTKDRRKIHIQKNKPTFKEHLDVYRKILIEMTEAYYRNLSEEERQMVENVFPKIIQSLENEEQKNSKN